MKKLFTTTIALMLGWGASTFAQGETGVKIGDLIWATRNVGAPGTFVANPEDIGMYYQWNVKIGWTYVGDVLTPSNATSVWKNYYSFNAAKLIWEAANTPCPEGWRVPTIAELASLGEGEWIDTPIAGRVFGSDENTIFLPTTFFLDFAFGEKNDWTNYGSYWSSSSYPDVPAAYQLAFSTGFVATDSGDSYARGNCVRCVKDDVATSVKSVPASKNISGYYNVMGKKLETAPTSGIYIIQYDNGKTEKAVK